MTPEELKQYVEHRLSEGGCSVQFGKSGFDRMFRFTEGAEDGARALCHKLASLGALQRDHKIDDALLDMAISDMARGDSVASRAAAVGADFGGADLASIDQLAAVLEARVADAVPEPEFALKRPSARTNGGKAGAAPARLPKVLVVDPQPSARAAHAQALAKDFSVVEAEDGEEAWKTLLDQPDIELMVTDLGMPRTDGYELIKRVRTAASPAHLSMLPIIVATRPEEEGAKLRALMAGANDFILKNATPPELRARVLARHRLAKNPSFVAAAFPADAHTPVRPSPRADGKRKASAQRATPAAAPEPRETLLPPLTVERRIPADRRPAASGAVDSSNNSFLRQLYRISSTTTITLSATALLALAVLGIIYTGRTPSLSETTSAVLAPTSSESMAQARKDADAGSTPKTEDVPALRSDTSRDQTPLDQAARDQTTEPKSRTMRAAPSAPATPPVAAGATPLAKDVERSRDINSDAAARTSSEPPAKTISPTEEKPVAKAGAAPAIPGKSAAGADVPAAPVPVPVPETKASEPVARAPEPVPSVPAPARPAAPATDSAAGTRDQTALADRAPAPAAPSAATNRISKDELSAFLRRFASIYEAGDLDQFVALFADNARTNDRVGKKGIREDYEQLFRATDVRQMKLGEISWELEGNQAYGWGDFDVNVRRVSDRDRYAYTGSMTFVLEKTDGRLRIVRLYHGQRRAESE